MNNDKDTQGPWGATNSELGLSNGRPTALQEKLLHGSLIPPIFMFPFAHHQTFAQIVNWASRSYMHAFDEALQHSYEDARVCKKDLTVRAALRQRKLTVAQLPWKLQSPKTGNEQLDAIYEKRCKIIEDALHNDTTLPQMFLCLLEAIWYGKAGVMISWAWQQHDIYRICLPQRWLPINGDKIRFRWDGTPGVMVNPSATVRHKNNLAYTDYGTVYWLADEVDRSQFIICTWERDDADYWDGRSGGKAYGVGLRDSVYWYWYLKSICLTYFLEYIELVGANGFNVFFYEEGNAQSLKEVMDAALNKHDSHIIFLPRRRDGTQGGPLYENIPPNGHGGQILSFIEEYFDAKIEQMILGESLQNVGSKTAAALLKDEAFGRIVKFDALMLQQALQQDFINVIYKYSFPDMQPQHYARFKFIVDPSNAEQMLQNAQVLWQMGVAVDEGQLREITGLVAPKEMEHVVVSPSMQQGEPQLDINTLLEKIQEQQQQQTPPQEQPLQQQAGSSVPQAATGSSNAATITT